MKFCWGGNCLMDSNHSNQRNLVVELDGMVVPVYEHVPRAACKMLTLAWERRWDALLRRCETHSSEAFCKTDHSGRTALHLSTFTSSQEGCPIEVARAILKANRHAILVADHHSYTPLHNISLFQGGDELIGLFCDTALMVEQELQGRGDLPTPSRTSPLYLAAKRNAPLSTLRILLRTRSRQSQWIAPFTGGESYWDPQQTLDICSSPLEILLRGRTAAFIGISDQTKEQMKEMALNFDHYCLRGGVEMEQQHQQQQRNHYDSAEEEEIILAALDKHDESALYLWAKCLLLLQENARTISTTTATATTTTPTVSLVHTVASLRVPMPFLLQLAVEMFPDAVTQRDDTGNYPLCHILTANHPYATKQLLDILLAANTNANTDTNTKKLKQQPSYPPIHYIQECLSMAIAIGMTWEGGLRDIITMAAQSEALMLPDAKANLVPAFLAASHDASVDTIFYILQEEPQVVFLPRGRLR